MAGPVPTIRALGHELKLDVDGCNKSGHDGECVEHSNYRYQRYVIRPMKPSSW